jgi:hypothetical protein
MPQQQQQRRVVSGATTRHSHSRRISLSCPIGDASSTTTTAGDFMHCSNAAAALFISFGQYIDLPLCEFWSRPNKDDNSFLVVFAAIVHSLMHHPLVMQRLAIHMPRINASRNICVDWITKISIFWKNGMYC